MSSSTVHRHVTALVDQPREKAGLSIGRIINGCILLIHVATFITALCVIGLVGNLMGSIAGAQPGDPNATMSGNCPFYVGKLVYIGKLNYYPLASNGVCLWFIAGHTILAIAAIVFFIVGIVRIVFAMDIGFGTIAELIATPILFILAFAVAVSISVGIAITCSNLIRPDICSHIGFPSGTLCQLPHSTEVCWYNSAKRAEAAGWAVLIFLFIFFAISIARLVIFIRRRKEKRRRRQMADCDTTDDPPPALV